MSTNHQTSSEEPVKPWLSKTDSIISFLCDDGALYAAQHHNLSAFSPPDDLSRLEIKAPPHKGNIVIRGPASRELCASLCAGRATLIRKDGLDVLSVTFIPDEDEVEL